MASMRWPRGGVALLIAFFAGCGRESSSSPTSPPRQSSSSASTFPARPKTDPRMELEAQGRFVYERNCLVCHGRWGDGHGEMAEGMAPRPSNFTRARFKFRSTPSGSLPTDDDLRRVISMGIAGSSMPTFAHLSDRDLDAVVAYLKTFSRRWDDPGQSSPALRFTSAPEWLEDPIARRPHLEQGRTLFIANCAPCHGITGRGDGPAAAQLEDDAGRPAAPADLTTGLWKSGRSAADLFRTLTTGLDGTPMPSFSEGLGEGDRWDLVSFLLTLPTASAGPNP